MIAPDSSDTVISGALPPGRAAQIPPGRAPPMASSLVTILMSSSNRAPMRHRLREVLDQVDYRALLTWLLFGLAFIALIVILARVIG